MQKSETIETLEQKNLKLEEQLIKLKNKILKLETKVLKQERKILMLQAKIDSPYDLMETVVATLEKTEHGESPEK